MLVLLFHHSKGWKRPNPPVGRMEVFFGGREKEQRFKGAEAHRGGFSQNDGQPRTLGVFNSSPVANESAPIILPYIILQPSC